MSTPTDEPLSFVESVCFRPAMYTLNGSLPEVAAFLNGFYSGMGGHSATEAARQEAQFWSAFCSFACEELSGNVHGSWYEIVQHLQKQHADEKAAFAHLAALCASYRKAHEAF